MNGDGPPSLPPLAPWSERLRVRAGEAGPGSLLRLPALCDWLQEAAGNNATDLGWGTRALLPRGLTWVLSRLHVEVPSLPRWRDEAVVETWPSGVRRLWALREFRVAGADGTLHAVATSGWLLLKVASKRPMRPAAEIVSVGEASPPRLVDDPFDDLPSAVGGAPGLTFRVGRTDLDLNGHANNVALLKAFFEACPAPVLEPLVSFEADFRGEAFEGDLLEARSLPGEGSVSVSLVRLPDGRELLRGRASRPSPA